MSAHPSASAPEAAADHHVALLYQSDEERLAFLTAYLQVGLQNKEMCILVISTPATQITQALKQRGLKNIEKYLRRHDLQIFNARETYLEGGKFAASYMLGNVQNFLNDAKRLGYKGLRTAGEMNWLKEHPTAQQEAADYEHLVNSIYGEIPFTGLCLYATEALPDATTQAVLDTHPHISYNNLSMANPVFKPAALG